MLPMSAFISRMTTAPSNIALTWVILLWWILNCPGGLQRHTPWITSITVTRSSGALPSNIEACPERLL